MRGVGQLRRRVAFSVLMLTGVVLSGCKTWDSGPDRLYSPAEEVSLARAWLDGDTGADGKHRIQGMVERYYSVDSKSPTAEGDRVFYRNEVIARRMYIIDLEYSEYETALTNERQKFGFGTSVVAQSLTIASSLTTPLRSAQILAGAASGVSAARGFYDSEVVIAKTIQIAQGHMRAKRDEIAKRIIPLRDAPSTAYPLSAALHDLEDYYRAGTLTAGLIEAVGKSGEAADEAALQKEVVISGVYSPDSSTRILDAFLRPGGGNSPVNRTNLKAANACLPKGFTDVRSILTSSGLGSVRRQVMLCLKL
ncbi:hypothetical protein [Bradyrhizobium sp. 141]|uniref:hypothetical protein n=1 Tax=Bradyrhizobium sp. 141 TaxID=2782617 RepID=UPI001FF79F3A|nr:hypothetical protein [Bradyrhizobium sp. 141]MCK1716178.1 hypothetical protein [Bradyrhizobium sp. 141]